MNKKLLRDIHRELSFFFAGVIFIYAISGICLNHKRDFNPDISIHRYDMVLEGTFPAEGESDKDMLHSYISQLSSKETYTRHARTGESGVKVFFKGGSSLDINLSDGTAVYEKVRKRAVLADFNKLHYNPSRWWTWFSDIFAVCLVIITVTGLFMLKGKRGLWGRGGIEFIAGLLVPLIFLFLL